MGSPLGPTLANIIMTEFENAIIKPLITTGTIAFYKRYVDDTIVLAKPCDLDKILKQFNSFHPQIQFTIDQFSDNNIHFLDIQILSSGTTVYLKQTHTGQYQHFFSYTPWSKKIAWIRALIHRAHKICSNGDLLQKEIHNIQLIHNIISLFTPVSTSKHPNIQNMSVENNSNIPKIWIPLPYIGKHGLKLTNSFIRTITPLLKSECKITINSQTTDAGFFVSLKNPTPKQYKSSVVYEFKCPGCNANYIGKNRPLPTHKN